MVEEKAKRKKEEEEEKKRREKQEQEEREEKERARGVSWGMGVSLSPPSKFIVPPIFILHEINLIQSLFSLEFPSHLQVLSSRTSWSPQ